MVKAFGVAVAVAALIGGSTAASAAVVVTVPTPAVYTPPTSGGLIGQVAAGATGTDTFNFEILGSPALFSGQISNTSIGPNGGGNINFSNFVLDGVSGLFSMVTAPAGAPETWACCQPGGNGAIQLGVGRHQLTFTATNTSTMLGTYGGTFNFAAVPEPSTWAMMLLGFGGIGMAMRRRRTGQQLAAA